jgi:hypothetical protein
MVPHGNLLAFSKYVEDGFLRVWKGLKFAAKIHHKVGAASDGQIASGNAVSHKLRRNKGIEPSPLLGVDRMDKGLNGLSWIHKGAPRTKDESQVYVGSFGPLLTTTFLLRAEPVSISARRDPGVPLKKRAEERNILVAHGVADLLHTAMVVL